ncbi:hypothetical protein ACSBLW_17830 [Thioclava sp. FR2]|uniref:hypothetical protein n=1 Tax=Thioclava sp. FR2 TaxID=3445780 RepID=UPI003EC01310
MKKAALASLLNSLDHQEKAEIILCFARRMVQDYLFGIKRGVETAPADKIEAIYNSNLGLDERLAESIRTDDKGRMLKTGLVEVFRLIPIMQRQPSGPRFNAFLRHHLQGPVFRDLYSAAGLNVESIRYDRNFPVEPLTPADVLGP